MDFEHQHDIQEWLCKKNRHDFAVVLASRVALRGITTYDIRISRRLWRYRISRKAARLLLSAFRAAAAASACARDPQKSAELAKAVEAAVATSYVMYGDYSDNSSQSSWATAGSFERAALVAARPDYAFEGTAAAVYDVARGAEITRRPAAADPAAAFRAVFVTFAADATMLENGTAPSDLAAMPLWLQGIPESAAASWKRLSSALRNHSRSWQVWIKWYDDRLAGRPFELQTADFTSLLLHDAIWADGPKAANAELERLCKSVYWPNKVPVWKLLALNPNEQLVARGRVHQAVFVPAILFLIAGFVGWSVVGDIAGILFTVPGLLLSLYTWLYVKSVKLIVTSKRVKAGLGILRTVTIDEKRENVKFGVKRSVIGLALGFGTVTVRGPDGTEVQVRYIKAPKRFARAADV